MVEWNDSRTDDDYHDSLPERREAVAGWANDICLWLDERHGEARRPTTRGDLWRVMQALEMNQRHNVATRESVHALQIALDQAANAHREVQHMPNLGFSFSGLLEGLDTLLQLEQEELERTSL